MGVSSSIPSIRAQTRFADFLMYEVDRYNPFDYILVVNGWVPLPDYIRNMKSEVLCSTVMSAGDYLFAIQWVLAL